MRAWTRRAMNQMREMLSINTPVKDMARFFGRSEDSIRACMRSNMNKRRYLEWQRA